MAQFALCGFTLFYIGRVHELFSVLQPMRIVLILTALAIITAILLPPSQKHGIRHEREVRLIMLMATLGLVLVPFSVWSGQSLTFLIAHYLRVAIFFGLLAMVATTPRIATNLVLSLLLAIAILSVFTLHHAAVSAEAGGRAFASETYDPNDVAMIIDCTLPFAILGAVSMKGWRRLVAIVTAGLGIMAVVKTVSRGGFIGLLVLGILLVVRWNTVSVLRRIATLGVGAVLLIVAVPDTYWYSIGTLLNLNPTFDEGYLEGGMLGRTEIWKQGLMLMAQYSVIGSGMGVFEIAEGISHGGFGKWSAAHNSFIQIGTELGVVGLAAFVTLFVVSVRNARFVVRAARSQPALAPLEWIATGVELGLYTFVVVGFALSAAYSPLLYFLFGISTALRLQVARYTAAPVLAVDVVTRRVRSRTQ